MPLFVISNPVCGDGGGQRFVDEHVVPLLARHSVNVDKTVVTSASGHAGEEVVEFLRHSPDTDEVSLILSSGDGTLHEIINAVLNYRSQQRHRKSLRMSFALVPSGTANALYSSLFQHSADTQDDPTAYKLKSINALIEQPSSLACLDIAELTYSEMTRADTTSSLFAAVVTSTALHASILHDSEALRQEIPSLERFKIAAKNNITRWYKSKVVFLPTSDGQLSIYDPETKNFIPITHDGVQHSCAKVTMDGPFAYFTSTVNVDRLEPQFMISALRRNNIVGSGSMDVVMLRPRRSPLFQRDSDEDRKLFAQTTGTVLTAAYDGSHAFLRYDEKGTPTIHGRGTSAVEYIRCGGWEWIPDEEDDEAHVVCVDGSIVRVKKGSAVACKILNADSTRFSVYV